MRIANISTLAIQDRVSFYMKKTHTRITELSKEMITARHADLGIKLGMEVVDTLRMDQEVDYIETTLKNNALVKERLLMSQKALEDMAKTSNSVFEAFLVLDGNSDPIMVGTAVNKVKGALSSFTGFANSMINGEYLFSGIDTDVAPLKDYFGNGSLAKKAFDKALLDFLKRNSIEQPSGGKLDLSSMNGDQMSKFIEEMEASFSDRKYWTNNYSNASEKNKTSFVNKLEEREVSTNLNKDSVRKFVLLSVLAVEFLDKNIGQEARDVLNKRIISYASQSVRGLTKEVASLGITESRVNKINTGLDEQKQMVGKRFLDLVSVDNQKSYLEVLELKERYDLYQRIIPQFLKVNFDSYL